MINKRLVLACFIGVLSPIFTMYSDSGTYLSSSLGWSESLNSNLNLYLADQSDIKHDAEWNGNSFKDSLYYSIRVEKWNEGKGRGIEWVHHKIYLDNTTDTIEDFSISDGFNLLLYNWAQKNKTYDFIQRIGIGLVFAHVDVTLSGRERFYMDGGLGGSYISGITSQLSIEKWVYESPRHFVNAEAKLTASYARVPVSSDINEFADVPNIGFHILLGIGSKPIEKSSSPKDKALYFAAPVGYHLIAQYMPTDSID